MREYGQIQTSFWTDPDIQSLTDHGKILAAYLLTGPHSSSLGCIRVPEGYIMEDLKWTQQTVSKAFAELYQIGFVERDQEAKWVLIPKYLKFNPISNPNVASKIEKEVRAIPQNISIYNNLIIALKQYGKHFKEDFISFLNGIETVSKQEPTLPNPTQTLSKPDPEPNQSLSGKPDCTVEIFEYWQQMLKHPQAKLDDKRKKIIKRAFETGYSVDECKAAILGCSLTPHNMGQNDRGEKYDGIDLIFRDADHIDRFIKNSKQPPKTNGAKPSAPNMSHASHKLWRPE